MTDESTGANASDTGQAVPNDESGHSVTLADAVLTSHVVGARLFKTDLSGAPKLTALADRCLTLPAFDPGRLTQGH